MYASITVDNFSEFYCRVHAKPVLETESYSVFELAGYDDKINVQTNGIHVGTVKHLAVDIHSIIYLYDANEHRRTVKMGPGKFIADGPNGPEWRNT
ncbi:hypothetical protein ACS0ZG_01090 [Burkholderia gladioli]|uniref:hypothetical protein n=1 Tax=Burkholderia gladioli TaxID=28095 RepID=UPI003F7955B0